MLYNHPSNGLCSSSGWLLGICTKVCSFWSEFNVRV